MDNKENENINAAETKSVAETQSRWRSPVVWTTIAGAIATVFSVFGLWEKIGITAEGFSEIVGAIGTVLAAFGIVNNPTSKNSF